MNTDIAKETIRNLLNEMLNIKMTNIENKQNKDMQQLSSFQNSLELFKISIDNLADRINNIPSENILRNDISSRNLSSTRNKDFSSERNLKSSRTVANLKTNKFNE